MPCFWCFFKTYQIHSNPSCWFWVRSPVLNKVIWCGTHPVFCCASSSKSLISMPLVTSVMPSSHTKSILLWQYGNYGYYGYYWLLLVTNLTIDTMVTMVSGVPPKYANGPMVSFFLMNLLHNGTIFGEEILISWNDILIWIQHAHEQESLNFIQQLEVAHVFWTSADSAQTRCCESCDGESPSNPPFCICGCRSLSKFSGDSLENLW